MPLRKLQLNLLYVYGSLRYRKRSFNFYSKIKFPLLKLRQRMG